MTIAVKTRIQDHGRARTLAIVLMLVLGLTLSSCVDSDTRISLGKNGTGRIELAYTIDAAFMKVGELEANRADPPIPLSRSDMERGIAGIPGLKLQSWARSDSKTETSIKATVSFQNLAALAAFLDPRGERVAVSGDGNSGTLTMTLLRGAISTDKDVVALLAEAGRGKTFKLSVQSSAGVKKSEMSAAIGKIETKGDRTAFSVGLDTLATVSEPVVWTVGW